MAASFLYMYTTLNFYEGIMVKNEQFSRVGKKNIHILTGNKSFFKLPYGKRINHRERKDRYRAPFS
jgi:hypothetical protein